MNPLLSQAIHYWRYGILYADRRGYYRWSRKAALPPHARAGSIASPHSRALRAAFKDTRELTTVALQGNLWPIR